MKYSAVVAGVFAIVSAASAWADGIDPALDVNGDGSYSYTELMGAYAGLTAEQFGKIDTSGDGLVSAEEFKIALEAGLLRP